METILNDCGFNEFPILRDSMCNNLAESRCYFVVALMDAKLSYARYRPLKGISYF